ncbi:MAG: Uncharacterised protein [Cyanobium sp. ARS6]|nr:MAG: Uncharacterised protein [Cyanobium sp. ARS6]
MPIARNHLSACGVGCQSESFAGEPFHLRIGVGVSAHGSTDLTHGHIPFQPFEALGIATGFGQPAGQLESKRDRFTMNGVGATDHHGGFVLRCQFGDGGVEGAEFLPQQYDGCFELQGQTCVQHIAAGHSHVDVATRGSDVLVDVGQESDHVVTHFRFDLKDPPWLKSRLAADVLHGFLWNASQAAVGLAGRHFNVKPALILGLVGPDRAHFGQGVALDQGIADKRSIPDHTVTLVHLSELRQSADGDAQPPIARAVPRPVVSPCRDLPCIRSPGKVGDRWGGSRW